jgi:hypothetical protein
MNPTTVVHQLVVELHEGGKDRADGWQCSACCRWSSGQIVVEPDPAVGGALPLHADQTRNDRLTDSAVGERWRGAEGGLLCGGMHSARQKTVG